MSSLGKWDHDVSLSPKVKRLQWKTVNQRTLRVTEIYGNVIFFEVFVFAGSTLPRCITRKPVVIAWSGSWTVNGIGNRKLDL